jgi:DNA (cytosine-5)-methyltransferase 1
MRHGSLFSGIGGFDLAAEWMGWTNVFHCEINPFCNRVLKYHFPQSIGYENIKETTFSVHRGDIDILTGGFPCQPYSIAGKRLGKQDERHQWPEMLRAIREIEPTYIVGENVRGLPSWNEGVVLDEIYADLEAEGYEVGAFVLPAVGVNAPHRRDRVWIIASNTGSFGRGGRDQRSTSDQSEEQSLDQNIRQHGDAVWGKAAGRGTNASHANSDSFAGGEINRRISSAWQEFPHKSAVCGGDDGLPRELDNITFSKWRKESVKAYGNAIVPQVAFQIFKAIAATYE